MNCNPLRQRRLPPITVVAIFLISVRLSVAESPLRAARNPVDLFNIIDAAPLVDSTS